MSADVQFLSAPAGGAVPVTKSDTTVLVGVRSLYVGVAGDVAVTMTDGSTATFTAVPAGSILPIQCTKVMSTGTSASAIVALN